MARPARPISAMPDGSGMTVPTAVAVFPEKVRMLLSVANETPFTMMSAPCSVNSATLARVNCAPGSRLIVVFSDWLLIGSPAPRRV